MLGKPRLRLIELRHASCVPLVLNVERMDSRLFLVGKLPQRRAFALAADPAREHGVRRLADEPELRADLVAAARERMAAEYSPKARAALWAEAFAEARA